MEQLQRLPKLRVLRTGQLEQHHAGAELEVVGRIPLYTSRRMTGCSMGQPETKVGDLCEELWITRQTLYRHVSPQGELRPDGVKLLSRGSAA